MKKNIVGLVGETGSGKDTFCQYIKKISKKPVFYFRFSTPLTEALNIFLNEIKKEDQQWLGIMLRQRFGNNILGKAIVKKIKSITKGIVILNGIRYWEEYKTIKKLGGEVIYITAEQKLRWQRLRTRGEKKDDRVSFKKFLELERAKTELAIPRIGKKADFEIENNGTKQDFYQNVRAIFKNF